MGRNEDVARWLKRADRDIAASRTSRAAGDFPWAAFQAHQAAEKGLAALLLHHGFTGWRTHSLVDLVRKLGDLDKTYLSMEDTALQIDRHYIDSRYPSSYDFGEPADHYSDKDAADCVAFAERVLSEAHAKTGLPAWTPDRTN
ncbi:MAG: HEPN domain-containing protein [Planctomycetes bacterium]|nr:HEPN domain-containing protein [Planctomycetota bacterium]